jgi:hypothetical protein
MMNDQLDDQANGTVRHIVHTTIFYMRALILAVLTTGILVIVGLSVLNRLEPPSNTTVVLQRSDLPPITNKSTKGNKGTNMNEVQKLR